MAAQRTRFSQPQLTAYFGRISLPVSSRIFDVSALSDNEKLQYLSLLMKHQLVKVPWENIDLHYSWHHVIETDPEHVFDKIVGTKNGRGGYCMEDNSFFATVLLSLGYTVYMGGSRICDRKKMTYGGWTHCVSLITIGDVKYMVDVGFGGNGSTKILPLEHGKEHTQVHPASMRLIYQAIPQNLDQSQKVWQYQHRMNETAQWETQYLFVELEFLPEDLEAMNLYPATSKHTFFTYKVVAVRFTTAGEKLDAPGAGEEELEKDIDGALILSHDVLKWRRNGSNAVRIQLKTEKDRLDALEKYFGMRFSKKDRKGISGTAAELEGNPFEI